MTGTVSKAAPVARVDGKAIKPAKQLSVRPGFPGNQALLRMQPLAAARFVPGIQAKLRIGAVDDPLEREADLIADQAMRMPEPAAMPLATATGAAPVVQRKCAECEEEDGNKLQAKPMDPAAGALAGGEAPPIVHDVLRSPGRPLDPATRAFFEPRFGRSLASVRVQTGARAAEAARAVNALAFTAGPNLVFGNNKFAPSTLPGQILLAHELAHMFQQGHAAGACQYPQAGVVIRRRAVTRDYVVTAAAERGPLCDVILTITGAPETDTEELQDVIDAAQDGIRHACGTLPRASSRAIRVAMDFHRGMEPSEVSQRAYVAARISVIGRTADPAYIAEQERIAAERARIELLEARYEYAVRTNDWQVAAEYLNAFSDSDIATRLGALSLMQLAELRYGAVVNPRLGGGTRLAALIDRANPDAARVATLIDGYERALAAGDWAVAAEHLNGFSESDIRARLGRLNRIQLSNIRDGAIRNPRLGRGARLVGLIDSIVTGPPLVGVGAACFDGATITVTKNQVTHECAAFTGSVGAPTPNGRFCVRRQGEAQIAGGITGRLFQDRDVWFLLEPQFSTTRFRMQLHPGVRSAGCITVNDRACFDQLAAVLQYPGTDTGRGYDGYPPGNSEGVVNPERSVTCVAWLDVTSTPGSC